MYHFRGNLNLAAALGVGIQENQTLNILWGTWRVWVLQTLETMEWLSMLMPIFTEQAMLEIFIAKALKILWSLRCLPLGLLGTPAVA